MPFDPELIEMATLLNERFRAQNARIATAESCTGGMISALLTEIPGSSEVFERGFVTYSNQAKIEQLGVDPAILDDQGAVSAETAYAMASWRFGSIRSNRMRGSDRCCWPRWWHHREAGWTCVHCRRGKS